MIAKFLAYLERDYLKESSCGYWIFLLALCMTITGMLLLLSLPLPAPGTEGPISLMDIFLKKFSTPDDSFVRIP